MKGHILMSTKEVDRIPTIEKLVKGDLTNKEAAERLKLSIRQIIRLKIRYIDHGPKGLIHKNRGKLGNRAVSKKEIERIMQIIKSKYEDFGPTLALEKLKKHHSVNIGRERLRLAMVEKGLWIPKKRKASRVFQIRARRSREGELVQADGSPHAWFEDRGSICTLLVFIDDATGKLKYLQFVDEETTNAYFKAMDQYIRLYGKPLSLYVDKHSIFRTTRFTSGFSAATDSLKQTQFTRAMDELSIKVICANTPQAKGRVEKVNSTLQDRLVKEMRLNKIDNKQEGNKYLPTFIKEFNEKFSVEPVNPNNAHCPLLPKEDLNKILVKKQIRVLSRNLTFQYKSSLYQVDENRPSYALRHALVEIHEDWDNRVSVYYKGKLLSCRLVESRTPTKVAGSKQLTVVMKKVIERQKPSKPTKNHPWKRWVYR